jgi:signal transduction histidine kinase
MRNHTGTVGHTSKILPFLRSITGLQPESTPQIPTMEARLSRPVLVRAGAEPKPVFLPRLSPAAALAHDARNALCSLELLSGLLAEPGVLTAEYAHFAGDLQSVAESLGTLVGKFAGMDQLPKSAGFPAGQDFSPATLVPKTQTTPQKRAKSAGEAVKNCTRLLRSIAGPGVEVHVSAENALPPMAIAEDALLRVLMNLVKNSSEAMPGGGMVHITARRALSRTAPAVLVHVSDNGSGIPAHALEHIFKPGFSSKRNSRSTAEECGLGLAIVRELVEASGG